MKNNKIEQKEKYSAWVTFKNIVIGKTIPQKMFRFYFLTIILGAILLYCPFSLVDGYSHSVYDPMPWDPNYDPSSLDTHSFWDALFTACSAFSNTGLLTTTIFNTYNSIGQAIILILIQLGGLGLMSIIFLLWNVFRKWNKVNINQVIILQAERGNTKIAGTYRSLKKSIFMILGLELLFTFLMAFWFCFVPAYMQAPLDSSYTTTFITHDVHNENTIVPTYGDFAMSLWYGLFTSISAINNAGIDIIGANSLAPYRNDLNIILQLMVLIEFVIGGIGFPLIYDLMEKRKAKKKNVQYQLSLFTKLALVTYILVTIIGLIFAFSFEYIEAALSPNNPNSIIAHDNSDGAFGNIEWLNKNFAIFFNTMSTRSCGFCTINQHAFSTGSKWLFIVLMYIGASPSSTAGGIRTTTFAIVICDIWSKILGHKELNIYHRQISKDKVKDAYMVMIVGILLIIIVCIISFYSIPLSQYTENNMLFIDVLFDTSSAFGTCGLSMNSTMSMEWYGLVFIMILMFIGQLSISSTLLSWTKKNPNGNEISYPVEDVRIG